MRSGRHQQESSEGERSSEPLSILLPTSPTIKQIKTMSIPATQKAWIMTSRGTPSAVLKLDEAYPVPTPGQGEVVVKVKYAALNPVGYKTMGGPLSLMRKVPSELLFRP